MTASARDVVSWYLEEVKAAGRPWWTPSEAQQGKLERSATRFLRWCESRETDPRDFLRFRVRGAVEAGRPLPSIHRLPSDGQLVRYRGSGAETLDAQVRTHERLEAEGGTELEQVVRALRLPARAAREKFRRRYVEAGKPHLCRVSLELGGGHDPRSQWCSQCSEASLCARDMRERYGFDVTALREGRVQELPRQVAAAAVCGVGIR
jgi:hypothetical protein